MAIRTPRPLDPDRGFITQAARVFTEDIDRRRQLEDAEEIRELQIAQIEQEMDIAGRRQLRAEGFETPPGLELRDRQPAVSTSPRRQFTQRQALQPGVEGRFSLRPGEAEQPGVEGRFALETPPIAAGAARPRDVVQTPGRRLEPARDPSIVHPELLDQGPGVTPPNFDDAEDRLNVPRGTFAQAFPNAPGAVISALTKVASAGSLSERERFLDDLRAGINAHVVGLKARMDNSFDEDEIERLGAEVQQWTQGLLDVTIGDVPEAETFESVIDRIADLDLTEDEKVEAVTEFFRRRVGRETTFERLNTGRGRLEPGR